jgi:hypothetical protein
MYHVLTIIPNNSQIHGVSILITDITFCQKSTSSLLCVQVEVIVSVSLSTDSYITVMIDQKQGNIYSLWNHVNNSNLIYIQTTGASCKSMDIA